MTRKKIRGDRAERLAATQLGWTCPSGWLPRRARHDSYHGAHPVNLLGQERALDALEMGLTVQGSGYNVFVSGGASGVEKAQAVEAFVRGLRWNGKELRDHAFVHNFVDPLRPRHVVLPAGKGAALREAMSNWKRVLQREIPRHLDSEAHLEQRNRLFRRYQGAEDRLFRRLSRKCRDGGLALVQVEDESGRRPDIYLQIGGETVAPDAVKELPAKQRPRAKELARLLALRDELDADLRVAQRKSRALALRMMREAQLLDEDRMREVVEGLTLATAEDLGAGQEVAAWLGDCARFALANLSLFRRGAGGGRAAAEPDEEDGEEPAGAGRGRGLEVFDVNVVRSAGAETSPIVFELHPNYSNLFGSVERRLLAAGPGHYHLAVRPGSLLAADGGFLLLNARDSFKEAEVWRALKRTLQNQRLEIVPLEGLSPLGVTGVRPEPIPIRIKAVLLGDNELYESLHETDFDFPRIFKVKAEFDDTLPLTRDNVSRLAQALQAVNRTEQLLPLARSGLQALIERGVRDAGRRNRISARVQALADYARESSYYARKSGKRRVDREAVDHGRRRFRHQHSLDVEWHGRAVLEGLYQIATSGLRTGSVNALTVISLGPLLFGRVVRISASVAAGEDSCLNIEREAELSGPIHDKGVLILESFLRCRFGQRRTLPIKASLSLEQHYGTVDGDSASATEVYALLSAIAGLPLRQDVAVTGAINLQGELLAVGSVNEKIECFFELCRARGLTGQQGVLLPEANLGDLMLDDDIRTAVRRGDFSLWTARTADQGIALLTGLPSGARGGDGRYPADSVMGRVEAALDVYERGMRDEKRAKKRL